MKNKLKPCFRASLQPGGVLELLVYEQIGEDWWSGGGLTAKTVKQRLDLDQGTYNSIAVRINSPGGDAFEGVAIMNLLKAQKVPVNVAIDGIAASAASIIAMAGTTITMGKSSMMMVHNAWTFCAGDGDDMRKCADTLDKISSAIGESYVARTGKTAAQVKDIMDAETWLSAQECVDQGFATAIAVEDEDAEAMALAKSFKALAKLKNLPESLRSPARAGEVNCTCICAPCAGGDCDNCDCEGCSSADCAANACNCGHGVEDDDVMPADNNLSRYEALLKLL